MDPGVIDHAKESEWLEPRITTPRSEPRRCSASFSSRRDDPLRRTSSPLLLPPPDSQVSTVVPLTLRKPGLRAEGRIMLICVGHTALQRAAARTAVVCVPAIEPCLTPAGAAAVDCARCCPLSAVSSRRQGPALSSCSRTHVRHHRALVHKL
jgi:hypothetical protein